MATAARSVSGASMSMSNSSWTFFCPSAARNRQKAVTEREGGKRGERSPPGPRGARSEPPSPPQEARFANDSRQSGARGPPPPEPATPRHRRLQTRGAPAHGLRAPRPCRAVPASRACDADPGKDASRAAVFSRYLTERRLGPRCRARRSGSRWAEPRSLRFWVYFPRQRDPLTGRGLLVLSWSRPAGTHRLTFAVAQLDKWPNSTGLTIVLHQGRLGRWFAEAGGSSRFAL